MRTGVLVNAIAFQSNWFAVILGAAAGVPWLGVGTSLAFVAGYAAATRRWAGVLVLAAASAAIGYAADSVLVLTDLLGFPEDAALGGPSTLWMVALWAAIACTLHSCMGWMKGRPLVAAVFGLLGGAGSYFAGERLGAVTFPAGDALGAAGAGVLWMLAMPALSWLAPRLDPLPAGDRGEGGGGRSGRGPGGGRDARDARDATAGGGGDAGSGAAGSGGAP